MNQSRTSLFLSALCALPLVFVACGGLEDGEINIVDDDASAGGDDGSGTSGGDGNAPEGGTGDTTGNGGGAGAPIISTGGPPTVVSITPEDAASDAEPNTDVTILFSESLSEDTVTADSVIIRDGETPVPGTLGFSGVTATFTPNQRLDLLANYTVTVTTAVTDLDGVPMEAEFTSAFTVRDGAWGDEIKVSNDYGDYTNLSSQPTIEPAVDANGNVLVVWEQPKGSASAFSIWGRFYDPAVGWGDPFEIDKTTRGCTNPAVAMNENGDAVVAWVQHETADDHIVARRYIDGEWETSANRVDVNDDRSYRRPVAGVSPGGDFHVAWTYFSTYYYVHGNHASGTGDWGVAYDNTSIGSSAEDISNPPAMAFDQDDNGIIIWAETTGTASTVFAARYLASDETWNYGETISASHSNIGYLHWGTPRLAIGPNGGAMAAWLSEDGKDIEAARYTKASGWDSAADIDGSSTTIPSWDPHIAYGGGTFTTAWIQRNSGGDNNVYANSSDGDTWGAQAALISDGDHFADASWSGTGFGKDRHGNGIAVWSESNAFNDNNVMFARLVGSSGEWLPRLQVNAGEGAIMEAQLTVAPNGVAVALWSTGYHDERRDNIFASIFK